jgi:putative peptidoglycan lipid II flippase
MSKQLAKSTGAFGGATLVSRILGLIRDNIAAIVFGTTSGYDAFLVAFKIPNFMRRLFAEGAFSQAFVPLLSGMAAKEDQTEIKNFINNIAGTFSLVLIIVSIIGIVCAPLVIALFAPGFEEHAGRADLATTMLRITFPYLLFISLAAFIGSILNTFGQFAVPAFTPVFLNIAMIVAALFFTRFFDLPIYALAWGVFFGGLAQLLFQVPFLIRLGYFPRPRLGFHDPHVRRLLKLMVPALLGVSVAQINLLIDTIFASFLQTGSISWLYYADRLVEFPLGMFGVALATVVLPHLSRQHANKAADEYSATLDWALRSILVVGIPASIGLFILAKPMVATFFQYGRFHARDVLETAPALQAMAVGLIPFMAIKVLASGFYAQHDIRTPVRIAIIGLITNAILNAILMQHFLHVGLATATTCSAILNATNLFIILVRRGKFQLQKGWLLFLFRMAIVNSISLFATIWMTPSIETWLEWHAFERVGHLLLIVSAVGVIYFIGLRAVGFRYHELLAPRSPAAKNSTLALEESGS